MHIVSSADNSCSWVVELFRTPVALSLQDAASFANSLSATLGLTYLANKGRQHLSCCKSDGSKSLADFGHAVSLWGALKSNGNFVYVEPIQSGILAIAVQDGVPAYDGVIGPNELTVLLDNYFDAPVVVYVGGQFEPGSLLLPEGYNSESVERLTVNLSTSGSELQPLNETLKRTVNPSIKIVAVLFALLLSGLTAWVIFNNPPQEAPKNPYESFYSFLKNDSINVLNRANQDFNEQIKLLSLHGWQLKSVTHTRASVAYELQAKSDGADSVIGDIATLERYAALNNMTVLFEPGQQAGAAVLLAVASNIPATEDLRLYSVEQVFRTLKDAIELYIPGSTVEFVREVGQSGSVWKLREVLVHLTNHDVRYLNTLGAIVEELPVTFGGDKADLQISKLTLSDNGELSGTIKLTVIGE